MQVKSYGYKVSGRPDFATIDQKTQLFMPMYPGSVKAGRVLKLEACEEPGLTHLMLWTVDMSVDQQVPSKPADVVEMQAATFRVEVPIQATCSLIVERDES